MTRQEREDYQHVLEIIRDQMALEDHQLREYQGYGAIGFSRTNTYREIVKTLTGIDIDAHASSA